VIGTEGVAMRARLFPLDGGPPVELTRDITLVGRGDDCELRIEHKSVSKRHCVLVKTDGLILIRDLGSTNGTRVNGQRVRRAALLPNDTLSVANFRYAVKFGDGPAPPPVVNPLPDAD
jgi:pSer/pThr/pTyr-binding forkhead associated (FHA) protein